MVDSSFVVLMQWARSKNDLAEGVSINWAVVTTISVRSD